MNDTLPRNSSVYRGRLPLLGWAVTAALVAVILYCVPLDEAWRAIRDMSAMPALLAVVLGLSWRLAFIYRWHLLLGPSGVSHSVLHTFGLGFLAFFYNNFAPATLGGDIAKAYMAARGHGVSGSRVAASVLADRGVGLLSVVVLGLAATAIVNLPPLRLSMAILIGGAMLGLLVVYLVATVRIPPTEAEGSWVRRRAQGLLRKLTETSRALKAYAKYPWLLVAAFMISCLGTAVVGITLGFWARALGFELGWTDAVAIAVMSSIVGMVPLGVNGLGWQEGALIVLLTWAEMGAGEALALVTVVRLVGTVISLSGGLLHFARAPSERGGK